MNNPKDNEMAVPEDLAEAYMIVARTNHYMVGVVGDFSQDDMAKAQAILLEKQHGRSIFNTPDIVKRALDLLRVEAELNERP
jgi:hypothetical protein